MMYRWCWAVGAAAVMVVCLAAALAVILRHEDKPSIAKQVEEKRQETELPPRRNRRPPAPEGKASGATPAFVLLPGLLRDGSERALRVPAASDRVKLTLRSSIEITPGNYTVVIRGGGDNQRVWSTQLHYAHNAVVSISVPASLLKAGSYVLALSAISETGSQEDLQDFAFKITR